MHLRQFESSRVFVSILVLFLVPLALPAEDSKSAETDAEVWGGLVYAVEQGGERGGIAGEDGVISLGGEAEKNLRSRLGKVFVGREFHFLGEHTQGVFKQYESWLVPSRDLFVKLDSKGPAAGGGVRLDLQLWQDKKVIMKTDIVLRPGSPLFIEGPRWRSGNLLFVLLLR